MEREPKEKGGGYVIGEDARKAWKGFNSHGNVKGCNPGWRLHSWNRTGEGRGILLVNSRGISPCLSAYTVQVALSVVALSAKLHETVELG